MKNGTVRRLTICSTFYPNTAIIIISVFAFVFLSSCAAKNEFVLLPDSEGKTGRIVVSSKGGEQVLSEPGQATNVGSAEKAPSAPYKVNDERMAAVYGAALSALPPPPLHFTLYFKSGKAELTDDSRKTMDDIIAAVLSRKSNDISVVGHTDRVGSREMNFRLGLDRTETVKLMLESKGVKRDYIDTASHGEDNPLIKTDDEVAEPRNRRVEVVVR